MKKFMEPAIELEIFNLEDVIAASSTEPELPGGCALDGYSCTDDTPWG